METALTVVSSAPVVAYDREQINLIKDTFAKGASDAELALFVEIARRKGLDIFSRQIHLVPRWDKKLGKQIMEPQTGIDGYRSIAERTGLYDGQDGPYWCGDDGEWKDVWLSKKAPVAAKVMIYKKGVPRPFPGIALYSEYCQLNKDGFAVGLWAKMPANQLAKCAEALALRKAFPGDLCGLYTQEEMAQANVIDIESENVTHAEAAPVENRPPKKARTLPICTDCLNTIDYTQPNEGHGIHCPLSPGTRATEAKAEAELAAQRAKAASQPDPLPKFAQPEAEESPEQIEAEKQSLLARIKQGFADAGLPSADYESWFQKYNPIDWTRGKLLTTAENAEAKAAKMRAEKAPPAEEVFPDKKPMGEKTPAQLPDGSQKFQTGEESAQWYSPGEREAETKAQMSALDKFLAVIGAHREAGIDYKSIRAKVESIVGEFRNYETLGAADLAKATAALKAWDGKPHEPKPKKAAKKKGAGDED